MEEGATGTLVERPTGRDMAEVRLTDNRRQKEWKSVSNFPSLRIPFPFSAQHLQL